MRTIVLTAGRASRLGGLAPQGCKALTPVQGRPVIEWQLDACPGDPVIVAQARHRKALRNYGRVLSDDSFGGPARALDRALLTFERDESVTVFYADSFVTELPEGEEWVGVATGHAGRSWDVVSPRGVAYRHLHEPAQVCVGIYRFSETRRLRRLLVALSAYFSGRELGMAPVLNHLHLPVAEIPTWRDIGDPVSLAAA